MSRDKKIELPCKIGDTVYVILFDKIIKCEVNTIAIDENNDVYVKKSVEWRFFLRKRQKKNKKAISDHNTSSIKLRKFRWSSFKE